MKQESYRLDDRVATALTARGGEVLTDHVGAISALLVGEGRNVTVGAKLGPASLTVFSAAVAEWLSRNQERRALVILADERSVATARESLADFCRTLGRSLGMAGRQPDPEADSADVLVASADTLAARHDGSTLNLADFQLAAFPDLDSFTPHDPAALFRSLKARLRSQWERRTLSFSARFGVKERNLVLDITEAPAELLVEEGNERAKTLPQSTWFVQAGDKVRLLVGLMAADAARPVAVFCNLKDNAEEAAKRLRANGMSVEYVLGNLPRKGAILEAVKSGVHDVLVLTDQGAEGMPGSWAKRLVNWDLPLEGEVYGKRLGVLDPGADGSSVWNFGCDRYVYGIPAIEQYLGYGLNASPADPSLLAPEDKSEGMSFERRHDQGRGDRRDDRRSPRNDSGRPSQERRGGYERRTDGAYDGRNLRSIQADIAALTGASDRPLSRAPERKPDAGRPGGRGDPGRRPQRDRQQGKGRQGERPRQPDTRRPIEDPYSVSMEERMRMYRERYGSRLTSSPQKNGERGSPKNRKGRTEADNGEK